MSASFANRVTEAKVPRIYVGKNIYPKADLTDVTEGGADILY